MRPLNVDRFQKFLQTSYLYQISPPKKLSLGFNSYTTHFLVKLLFITFSVSSWLRCSRAVYSFCNSCSLWVSPCVFPPASARSFNSEIWRFNSACFFSASSHCVLYLRAIFWTWKIYVIIQTFPNLLLKGKFQLHKIKKNRWKNSLI